jgi:hypothetical protein
MLSVVIAIAAIVSGSAVFAQDEEKGPPLPFITIEGQGGGAITPMAYLVNPAPEGKVFGKPSVALDYISAGRKNMDAFLMTENVLGRIELGFAADRLGLGTLPSDVNSTLGANYWLNNSDVWLYNFNVRYLAIKENYNDHAWMPALTFGATVKYNADIDAINTKLQNAFGTIGYNSDTGVDFTMTATKTFGTAFFGRPLIVSAGMRESQAADLGFLGFGDKYRASFEGNVVVLPADKWMFAYEFRQKSSPYGTIGPGGTIDVANLLVGDEDNWHAFDVGYIASKHTTVVVGAAILGNLCNTEANSTWFAQLKYEF